MKRSALSLVLAAAIGGVAVPCLAQAPNLARVPEELRSLYQQNLAALNRLYRTIGNEALPAPEREAAFRDLQLRFPHASLEAGVSLSAQAKSTDLAVEGARYLAAQIAMMNHPAAPGAAHPHAHANDPISIAKKALQARVLDERREVRAVAAEILASLGDEASLGQIATASEKGTMPSAEAVRYLTLSGAQVGASYVERILRTAPDASKAEAIRYLAPLPDYRNRIRDQYLLNESTQPALRAAAAGALARSDPQFNAYGLALASNPKLPAPVVNGILSGIVEKEGTRLDAAQIEAFRSTIRNVEAVQPDSDFSRLKDQLTVIRNRL